MYIWKRPRIMEKCVKMAETLILKYYLWLKTKEDIEVLQRRWMQFTWRWNSKCLIKRKVCWALWRQWDPEKSFNKQTLPGSSCLHTLFTVELSIYLPSWNFPLDGQGEGQRFFLSVCGLKCNQSKLILMPKWHILGWQILPPTLTRIATSNNSKARWTFYLFLIRENIKQK